MRSCRCWNTSATTKRKERRICYLWSCPGSLQTKKVLPLLNFTPPPRRSTQEKEISVDLQQFRLYTGAPIYIDFKSIPYKDVEGPGMASARFIWNYRLYEAHNWNDPQIQATLESRGISHVVVTADRDVRCDFLQLVYADKYFRLYRLIPGPVDADR